MKSERVKNLMGPGGLRCGCCGASAGRHRAQHKNAVRGRVRSFRRANNKRAIDEGSREVEG